MNSDLVCARHCDQNFICVQLNYPLLNACYLPGVSCVNYMYFCAWNNTAKKVTKVIANVYYLLCARLGSEDFTIHLI